MMLAPLTLTSFWPPAARVACWTADATPSVTNVNGDLPSPTPPARDE